MRRTPDALFWRTAQLGLAGGLALSHFVTASPYVYPHYVLLILLHPMILRRGFGIHLRPWQVGYVSAGLFLHPLGGLYGLYSTVWWFDHATHTLSATLVAAIGFVIVSAYDRRVGPLLPGAIAAFTFAFVMSAGVLWELVETLTPILTVYGYNDTVLDYVFDAVGGLLVIVLGPRLLRPATAALAAGIGLGTVPLEPSEAHHRA